MDTQSQTAQEQAPLSSELWAYIQAILNQNLSAQRQQYDLECAAHEWDFTAETVLKLTCCHRSFKSKCEHCLFILHMLLIADEYNRDSHAAPTNQPQVQAVPAAAPSMHSNPSNTPSTSRLN